MLRIIVPTGNGLTARMPRGVGRGKGRGRPSARDALARLEAIGDSDVSTRLVPPLAGGDGVIRDRCAAARAEAERLRPVHRTNDLESALHKIYRAGQSCIRDAGSSLTSSDIATEVLRHAYSVGCPRLLTGKGKDGAKVNMCLQAVQQATQEQQQNTFERHLLECNEWRQAAPPRHPTHDSGIRTQHVVVSGLGKGCRRSSAKNVPRTEPYRRAWC